MGKMSEEMAVILPLYIYPFPRAWDPLYDAITKYPDVEFVVIVNPHNGPGESPFPDENYEREIPRLNSYANVCTVGYIRVNYCRREMAEVIQDVDRYASWVTNREDSTLGVHGIFVDETPNLHNDEYIQYLESLDQHIKQKTGILGDHLVIHNPGTVPDVGYTTPGPDVTTVVEESFSSWSLVAVQQRLSDLLRYDRSRCAFMVHSVPTDEIPSVVEQIRPRGKYLFLTNLTEHFYVSFGSSWKAFTEALHTVES